MCGRLCCYCHYESYSERLKPVFRSGKHPSWIDSNKFSPSSNVAPTRNIPILYIDGSCKDISIRPMAWGIELSNYSKTQGRPPLVHNVRIETLQKTGFFRSLLETKKSCAIVCDGFYEWNKKRPFFFYNATTEFDTSKITPKWKQSNWIEDGPPVMVLAGVYSTSVVKGEETYSCSVITKEASEKTGHIHHRIPIMLDTEEAVLGWLDPEGIEQSLRNLLDMKNENLSYYEVRDQVNDSRYQGSDCHFPLLCYPTSRGLNQWLSKSQLHDSKHSDQKLTRNESPSLSKRKNTSTKASTDSPSKKKSVITDWFKRAPPNP